MKRSKTLLIITLTLDVLITIATIVDHNYVASVGWGFLAIANATLLSDLLKKDK